MDNPYLSLATPVASTEDAATIAVESGGRQFDKQGNFIREWESQSEAARNLGLDTGNISSVCLEKVKTAGKFIWKFKKGE